MLNDILGRAKSAAYGHGTRYLAALGALDGRITPGASFEIHAAYCRRKVGFWRLVQGKHRS